MRYVKNFLIDGFESLKTLSIGEYSFDSVSLGDCVISNCPLLSSMSFGNYAFEYYIYFVLQNVPSLQAISLHSYNFYSSNLFDIHRMVFNRKLSFLVLPELRQSLESLSIGNYDFRNAMQVNLDGFSELTSISIGEYAFDSKTGYLSIRNCSKLQTISFGKYSFQYFHVNMSMLNSLQFITFGQYAFRNTISLSLHDLPQLHSITFNQYAFQYTKTASLRNIGKIIGLVFNSYCFETVDSISITSNIIFIHSFIHSFIRSS